MPMLIHDDPRAISYGKRRFWNGYWLGWMSATALIGIIILVGSHL